MSTRTFKRGSLFIFSVFGIVLLSVVLFRQGFIVEKEVQTAQEDRMQLYDMEATLGMQITAVRKDGTYMKMGFHSGDIIVGINAKRFEEVSTIEEELSLEFQNTQDFCLDILRGEVLIEHCYGE